MILVFEGIDASGKGEIGRRVAERLEGVIYKTPPKEYKPLMPKYDIEQEYLVPSRERWARQRFAFFEASNRQAGREIALLARNKVVIVDRWYHTTYAYHNATFPEFRMPVPENMWKGVKPDHVFLVTCEETEWWSRMAKKTMYSNIDQRLMNDRNLRLEIENQYRAIGNHTIIDNTGSIENSVETVFEHCLALV